MNKITIPAEEIKRASPEQLIRAFSTWIRYVMRRYEQFLSRSGVLDEEDLYWAGAMALVNAQKTWNPEEGNFLTYSFHKIRAAMQRQLRLGKSEFEPELIYLDAPLPEDDELTLLDVILSDEKSPQEIVEDRNLCELVQEALDRDCDPIEQEVLKKRYYDELSAKETAAVLKIEPRIINNYTHRGLNRLRRDHKLRNIVFGDYYKRVGLTEFKSTLTSETELAVLRKEKMWNEINGPGAYLKEPEIIKNQ